MTKAIFTALVFCLALVCGACIDPGEIEADCDCNCECEACALTTEQLFCLTIEFEECVSEGGDAVECLFSSLEECSGAP